MISWFKRRRARRRENAIRTIWLPVIHMEAERQKCVLSSQKEQQLLDYVSYASSERSTRDLIEDIRIHIEIGLKQPQCWMPLLIG